MMYVTHVATAACTVQMRCNLCCNCVHSAGRVQRVTDATVVLSVRQGLSLNIRTCSSFIVLGVVILLPPGLV